MTEKECVKRVACRYGATPHLATYICNTFTEGKAAEEKDSFNVPPLSKFDVR